MAEKTLIAWTDALTLGTREETWLVLAKVQ